MRRGARAARWRAGKCDVLTRQANHARWGFGNAISITDDDGEWDDGENEARRWYDDGRKARKSSDVDVSGFTLQDSSELLLLAAMPLGTPEGLLRTERASSFARGRPVLAAASKGPRPARAKLWINRAFAETRLEPAGRNWARTYVAREPGPRACVTLWLLAVLPRVATPAAAVANRPEGHVRGFQGG